MQKSTGKYWAIRITSEVQAFLKEKTGKALPLNHYLHENVTPGESEYHGFEWALKYNPSLHLSTDKPSSTTHKLLTALSSLKMQVAPPKWYIVVTNENTKMVNEWRHHMLPSSNKYNIKIDYCICSKHHLDDTMYYYGTQHSLQQEKGYKDYVELNDKQFQKWVLGKMISQSQPQPGIITRAQLKSIYDAACDGWKIKITAIAALPENIYADKITISEEQISTIFSAANPSQHTLLQSIFGEQLPHSTQHMKVGQVIKTKSGYTILKTFNNFVDINNPMNTWSSETNMFGTIYKPGTEFTITSK